jgi:NAD(P)-dependent dehydrogenase (short-subunit alcohol dehydrogenase family)
VSGAELLREGLLDGVTVLAVGSVESSAPFAYAVGDACERLGARVRVYEHDGAVDEQAIDRFVGATAPVAAPGGSAAPGADGLDGIDMLVVDGAALLAAGGLHGCLEGAWEATAAVVNGAFLPAARGGRIVYLAPAPGSGEQADAARAGLENLARTLSVEWARHRITVVTIALGDATTPGEAAALTAYLASPAGAYFSGCQFDLRGV